MTQQTQQQLDYTLATHAIERLIPSKAALRLCQKVVDGTMTADTAVAALLRQYGVKKAGSNG